MSESLVRSIGGLANQHLFYNVDVIIYTEGGAEHRTITDALNQGSDETHDSAFWRSLFRALRPHLGVQVKSVGSKKVAREIAVLVNSAGVNNILVCVDRDFEAPWDPASGEPAECRSRAYSWEGDLARLDVMEAAFFRIRPYSLRAQTIFDEYAQWHEQFLGSLLEPVCRDKERVNAGSAGAFCRDNPRRNIQFSGNQPPAIDEAFLAARINAPLTGSQPIASIDQNEICPHRDCFGKVIVISNYHAFIHYVQKVHKGRVDFDTFLNIAISVLSDVYVPGTNIYQYYDNQMTVH